ncbi:MAG: ABC transporter ATP-binding protein [Acidaminococcales bacterium]|jgi:iron complex transport system ATP-binding protein|nr:ABC transporter ATP-binding protein [Acidaminococcales bacterium]
MISIRAESITLRYGARTVVEKMSLAAEKADIVSIIGPNGSGKSTVLKALGRLLKPAGGTVFLDGKDIQAEKTGRVAQKMAILPQTATVPDDMTVYDLVCYGRMPYQKFFAPKSEEDLAQIDTAIAATGMSEMKFRRMGTLSGGERQRAWLSLAIAQNPKILLLDEPTTFLDIHHQLEIMKLIVHLHKKLAITVIMVLHDLNHAARFSNRIIAVKEGAVMIDGGVREVFREEILGALYSVKTQIIKIRQNGEEHLYCITDDVFEETAT